MLAVLRAEGSLAQRRLQIVNASFFPTPEIHSADDSDRLSDALRAGEEFCRKLGWLTAGGQVGLQLGKVKREVKHGSRSVATIVSLLSCFVVCACGDLRAA
jgi:hypothetical protein